MHEWGPTAGMPLLYWHGLNPFGVLELNEAGPAWAGRGFHVVGFAAPGIADDETFSDLSAYRPSRLAELIVETAYELELEQFAFVGWSWGASIGVHLAVRYAGRVAALVLLDAGHTDIPGDSERSLEDVLGELSSQQERYRFESWEAFLEAAQQTRPAWRPALEERVRAGMVERGGTIVARADRRAAAAAWHGLLQEQPSSAHVALGQAQIPVLLVLAAENDTTDETERFRRVVPQAELRVIDSGHDLLADAPAETIALVGDWLLAAKPYFAA